MAKDLSKSNIITGLKIQSKIKKCLSILFILNVVFFSTQIFCQVELKLFVELSPTRNVLYAGIANNLSINSALPLSEWEFECSNGTVKSWGFNSITITPKSKGIETIYVYHLSPSEGRKLILEATFPVDELPAPEIIIGKKNKITKASLLALRTFKIQIEDFNYFIPLSIISGNLRIIKKNGDHLTFKMVGNSINKELTGLFLDLDVGDILLFKDFMASSPDIQNTLNVKGTYLIIE